MWWIYNSYSEQKAFPTSSELAEFLIGWDFENCMIQKEVYKPIFYGLPSSSCAKSQEGYRKWVEKEEIIKAKLNSEIFVKWTLEEYLALLTAFVYDFKSQVLKFQIIGGNNTYVGSIPQSRLEARKGEGISFLFYSQCVLNFPLSFQIL